MNGLLHTTIRRAGLALVATALTAVFAGSALAGDDRPASSYYTPQQLEAISQSWAARARYEGDRPAASFYTPQQLQAISQSWAARARYEGDRPAASFYTPQQLQAISQSWAARGGVFDSGTTTAIGREGFDWRDFGIGAGAMLGLVLLLGGLAASAHFSRRARLRAHQAA